MTRACSRAFSCLAATIGLLVALAAVPAVAQVPSGSTLSPDAQSFLVNKDLGAERWTINLNLFSSNPNDVINITGNIFRSDGGPASFVICLVRVDSTGTLTDPASSFRLSCSGSNACTTTAEMCARDDWTLISDDVSVPASFFLPPGGIGTASALAGGGKRARAALAHAGWMPQRVAATQHGLIERVLAYASSAFSGFRGWVAAQRDLEFIQPRKAFAQSNSRGATLTTDRLNALVTKDVGAERWSISYSLEPTVGSDGLVVDQFLSVTGNVYQPDGSPPSFVYCKQRPDSTGTLSDPSSEFRFSCSGASACAGTASECAANGWTLISDDITLQASFFLPPAGLPATPQSDPEIVVIGRTSDPPSIVAPNFSTTSGAAATAHPAATCPVGTDCFVPTLGSCQNVQGSVVSTDGGGCGCQITDPSSDCIGCGGGTSGQCGGACEYAVGGSTARGTCLPFDYESEKCSCYAVGAGQEQAIQGCGGVLSVGCPGNLCCADDPRGACSTLGGIVECPGVCVAGNPGCFTGK